MKRQKLNRMLWWISGIIGMAVIALIIFINQPSFGKTPTGERLERVKNSPNYRDGKFQNLSETKQITSDKGMIGSMIDFLTRDNKTLLPPEPLPVIKTDLLKLDRDKNLLVWFGHSSYLMQIEGKRILVDPVFDKASPVSFVNKPFKGTEVYKAKDMPDVDYLIISHDHWDHLDYQTVKEMKNRIGKVICGLGVGEHFEYWGFEKDRIVELDWGEIAILDDGYSVHCLPARHFSGRGLSANQSLWASYLVQTPSKNVYIGGDGGYDTHFAAIGEQFGNIDLAILENGQYDKDWKFIHLMPDEQAKAAKDLKAKKILTVHHAKYALGKHPWDEPLVNITETAEKESLNLITPMIGEVVYWEDEERVNGRWWEKENLFRNN